MRVQQLLLSRVEDTLKPYGLTFAAYEALRLLAFSRRGSLPMGKMGMRLMVHPASVTNAIRKLELRGLVQRQLSPADRRIVLATITDAGRALADEATTALNQAAFGLPDLSDQQAAEITAQLRTIRALSGDLLQRQQVAQRIRVELNGAPAVLVREVGLADGAQGGAEAVVRAGLLVGVADPVGQGQRGGVLGAGLVRVPGGEQDLGDAVARLGLADPVAGLLE